VGAGTAIDRLVRRRSEAIEAMALTWLTIRRRESALGIH